MFAIFILYNININAEFVLHGSKHTNIWHNLGKYTHCFIESNEYLKLKLTQFRELSK